MLIAMNDLFNKTFYKFTWGFIGIIIMSLALAAVAARIDASRELPARATQ